MGTYLHGWGEVHQYDDVWWPYIQLPRVWLQDSDMYDILFGTQRFTNFAGVAPARGLPKDVSRQAKNDYRRMKPDAHAATWITWEEIAAIDWEAAARQIGSRVREYRRTGEQFIYEGEQLSPNLSPQEWSDLGQKGEIPSIHGKVLRLEPVQAKDLISGDWQVLFDCMKRLHRAYKRVRIVCWFDS